MSENRKKMVNAAFDHLDVAKAGKVEVSHIREKFATGKHPAVIEGRKTEKQILEEFTNSLDAFLALCDNKTVLSREQFLEFYDYISFTIDNDDYFMVMIKNSWNLDATSFSSVMILSPAKREGKYALAGESKDSPFKKSVAETASEQPLVKSVKRMVVEAPYHTAEEEKKSGNVLPEKMFQKTDELVLNRFRSAVISRGVKGILGIEKQFTIYARTGFMELDDLKKVIIDFRIPIDLKDIEVLFRAMDTDADTKVSYKELMASLIGEMSIKRKQLVEEAFKVIDKDNDGVISAIDISRTIDGLKHPDVKQGRKTQEDILKEILEILSLTKFTHVII